MFLFLGPIKKKKVSFIIPARVWILDRINFFLFAWFHMKIKFMDLFLLLW